MSLLYHRPTTLGAAIAALGDGEALPLAGGVSLVLLMNLGLVEPPAVVALDGIAELHGLELDGNELDIGALCTHEQLARDALVGQHLPAAAAMFAGVGNVRVRSTGTLGGNLVHADPAQDPPVLLTALDAYAVVEGPSGRRRIPIAELSDGPFSVVLEADEILTRVRVPLPGASAACAHVKFRSGSVDDYPTVSVAAWVDREGGGVVRAARLAAGAVGPATMALDDAARLLAGHALDDQDALRAVSAAVRDGVHPSTDRRGSADYKRHMAGVVAVQALRACADGHGQFPADPGG